MSSTSASTNNTSANNSTNFSLFNNANNKSIWSSEASSTVTFNRRRVMGLALLSAIVATLLSVPVKFRVASRLMEYIKITPYDADGNLTSSAMLFLAFFFFIVFYILLSFVLLSKKTSMSNNSNNDWF